MKYTSANLIIGYLGKTLDKEGLNDFYTWVSESPENKKLYFEARAIYEACSYRPTVDIDTSWQKLLQKKQKKQGSVYAALWKTLGRYAAVATIAITLTSTFLIFYQEKQAKLASRPAAQYISGDGRIADAVVLPDGTRVSIGNNTVFNYDPGYNIQNRIVYLEGEAFFDVAKQKDKPFIVKVKGQEIEALGTQFNIMAYPSDSLFTATLLKGSIQLTNLYDLEKTILQPNQQFTYNTNSNTAAVSDVDASLFTSWINGLYYFPDQTFETILSRLSTLYGIRFDIQSENLKKRKFTGTIYRGQSIRDILDIIHISIPIEYAITEERVIIKEQS